MINLDTQFDKIFNMFEEHQEYFQAVAINTNYRNPFVKLFYWEQLAEKFTYGREELIAEIKSVRQNLMEYFEAHPEDSI